MLESGFRISDLKSIPVNGIECKSKNKISFDNTFILGYAHTVYGINYNTNNYKIPLNSIRDDVKGYIGIESLLSPWSEQLKLWHGNWENNSSYNKSYVKLWAPEQSSHEHYNPNKFEDLENSYYIIKDAPYPYESGENNNRNRGEKPAITLNDGSVASINNVIKSSDPYTNSNKIVTKKYVDERLSSKRLVEVSTDFYIRDYDVSYVIRSADLKAAEKNASDQIAKIKIHYPESYNKKSIHNKLEFTLLIEGELKNGKWEPSLKNNFELELVDYNGKTINYIWLNNGGNIAPDASQRVFYDNTRYMIYRFESVTNSVSYNEVIEKVNDINIRTSYDIVSNFDVFILCENLLYRGVGVRMINDINGDSLMMLSSDDSLNISSSPNGSTIVVDCKVNET